VRGRGRALQKGFFVFFSRREANVWVRGRFGGGRQTRTNTSGSGVHAADAPGSATAREADQRSKRPRVVVVMARPETGDGPEGQRRLVHSATEISTSSPPGATSRRREVCIHQRKDHRLAGSNKRMWADRLRGDRSPGRRRHRPRLHNGADVVDKRRLDTASTQTARERHWHRRRILKQRCRRVMPPPRCAETFKDCRRVTEQCGSGPWPCR